MKEQQIKQIEKLNLKGLSQINISHKLNIPIHKVNYYINRKERIKYITNRFSKKSIEEKRATYRKRIPYLKVWFKNKYNTDPIFRAKHIENVKRCYNARKNKTKMWWM